VYHICVYFLRKPCPVIIYHSGRRWDGTDKIPVELASFCFNPSQNRRGGRRNTLPSLLVTLSTVKNMCPAWTASSPYLWSSITSPLNIRDYPSTPCEIRCLMFNYSGYKLHGTERDSMSTHPLPYAATTESGYKKSCFSLYHERLDSAFRGSAISPQTLSLPPRLMKPTVGSCCLCI